MLGQVILVSKNFAFKISTLITTICQNTYEVKKISVYFSSHNCFLQEPITSGDPLFPPTLFFTKVEICGRVTEHSFRGKAWPKNNPKCKLISWRWKPHGNWLLVPCNLEAGFKLNYVRPAKPGKGSGDEQSHGVNLFEIRMEITLFLTSLSS